MCYDIEAFIGEIAKRVVACELVRDERYGLFTTNPSRWRE